MSTLVVHKIRFLAPKWWLNTNHCCWRTCRNDSRYPDELPKLLKELLDSVRFPKPSKELEKCKRWVNACCRENFIVQIKSKRVKKNISKEHWPGGKEPIDDFPDPLKANFTLNEARNAVLKRKPPKRREQKHLQEKKPKLDDNPESQQIHEI